MKIKIEIEIEMASSCQDCRKYQDCLFLGNLLKGLIDTFSGRNLHHGCYSYHKLLRQPQRWCCRASVFLSFPSALGCILFMLYSYCFFVCHISGGGKTPLFLFSSCILRILFLFRCLFRSSRCHCIVYSAYCATKGRIGKDTGCAAMSTRITNSFMWRPHPAVITLSPCFQLSKVVPVSVVGGWWYSYSTRATYACCRWVCVQ